MARKSIAEMSVAKVYPLYIAKGKERRAIAREQVQWTCESDERPSVSEGRKAARRDF